MKPGVENNPIKIKLLNNYALNVHNQTTEFYTYQFTALHLLKFFALHVREQQLV